MMGEMRTRGAGVAEEARLPGRRILHGWHRQRVVRDGWQEHAGMPLPAYRRVRVAHEARRPGPPASRHGTGRHLAPVQVGRGREVHLPRSHQHASCRVGARADDGVEPGAGSEGVEALGNRSIPGLAGNLRWRDTSRFGCIQPDERGWIAIEKATRRKTPHGATVLFRLDNGQVDKVAIDRTVKRETAIAVIDRLLAGDDRPDIVRWRRA